MKKRSGFRPRVELLEDRTTPALSIRLDSGGHLTGVFGTPGPATVLVQLDLTANDTVHIFESDGVNPVNDHGTYLAGGSLSVDVGNTLTGIAVFLNGAGFDYSGNVSLKAGNAPSTAGDVMIVDDINIAGNLTITTGSGDDQILLGGFNPVTVGGNVSVNTNSSGGTGDSVFVGDTGAGGGAAISGNLTVTNATTLIVDATAAVSGMLNANASSKTASFNYSLNLGSTVGAGAIISTGSGTTDGVTLAGSIIGNTVVNQGNGTNTFNQTGTIVGSLNLIGGTGTDSGTFNGSIITGNVSILQGNGANTVNFGPGSTILGSVLTITGGTGVDSVVFNGLTAPGARLNASLGNGNDAVAFTVIPVLLSGTIDGGTGVNTFTSTGVIAFPFTKRNF